MQTEHEPSTPTEEALVLQIAMAAWRLRRLHHIEAGFFAVRTADLDYTLKSYKNLRPGESQAVIINYDSQGTPTLATLRRYEAHLQRIIRMSLQALNPLRASRKTKITKQPQPAPARPVLVRPDQAHDIPSPEDPPAAPRHAAEPAPDPGNVASPPPPAADMK